MEDLRSRFLLEIQSAINTHIPDTNLTANIINDIIPILNNYDLSTFTAPTDSLYPTDQLISLYSDAISVEGKSPKTVEQYRRILTRLYNDTNTPLDKLNVFQIRTWLINLQKQCSARTVENYRSYLSAFYQWAVKENLMDTNPISNVAPIKYLDEVKPIFTEVDIDMLRAACRTPRERAELELLLCSGIRATELCGLNRNDINFNTLAGVVKGKGNKERVIYITEICKKYLLAYLETRTDDLECMFMSRLKKRLSKESLRSDMSKLGKRANIDDVHPHRFRRTFATNLSKKGMNTRAVQKLMGHTDINTTMVYVTLDDETLRNEYQHYN